MCGGVSGGSGSGSSGGGGCDGDKGCGVCGSGCDVRVDRNLVGILVALVVLVVVLVVRGETCKEYVYIAKCPFCYTMTMTPFKLK